uniref:Protein FAM47E n=1 Tax=Sus scrofa TaxID=9823 RepID=A0A8D1Q364_PIG
MADRRVRFPPAAQARVPVGISCGPRCFPKHKGGPPGPTSLSSRRWRFVTTELDDFREGCPPCRGLITQGLDKGFFPPIYHRAPRPAGKRRQNSLRREAALGSRLSPARQARKAFLADVEAQLSPHPLALYPDLEEDLPAELLLKVLDVLDPDRKLEDTWASCQGIRKRPKENTKHLKKRSSQVYLEGSPSIDEEFILKQFDIDSQSKPSYNVLHAVRPNPVPLELKKRMGLNKLQGPQFFQKLDYEQRLQKPQNSHKPKWVKMRYGAWYLNTKLWKKQRADEPLVDPKVLGRAQDENLAKELREQEELLADLRGTVAFKDFILSRGYRMPRFLEKIYMRKEYKCECNKTPVKTPA